MSRSIAIPTGPVATAIPRRRPAIGPMPDTRPKVLHFTAGIGGGGAEAMLGNLVAAMHEGSWRSVIVAVDARPWPAQAARLRHLAAGFHDLESTAYLRPAILRRLHAILRSEKPDIVQTWTHHADLVGGLCARMAGVRRIVWGIHCREIHRNPGDGNLKIGLFRAALTLASRVVPRRIISCSAAAIEDHAAAGYPRRRMHWIPNGICDRRFSPAPEAGAALRQELGIPADAPVVGYAGRFHSMKQLETFLEAAALLDRRLPGAHYILCGGTEADLDPAARRAREQLPTATRLHFLPFRPDMERFYPALSVFSLSSRTEACPMTLLEAMACAVPCAATDVGDCAELVGHRAFVAPAGEPAALARAWESILTLNGAERADLGRALRARVQERFTIARAARLYEAAYADLLSSPPLNATTP